VANAPPSGCCTRNGRGSIKGIATLYYFGFFFFNIVLTRFWQAICLWIQFSISSLRRNLAHVVEELLSDLCVAFYVIPASGAIYALDRALEVCLEVRSAPLALLPTIERAIELFVQRTSAIPIAGKDLLASVCLLLDANLL
jgi:hypothetical protein